MSGKAAPDGCDNAHSRREKGGEALMTIEADSVPPEKITADIRQTPDVLNCLLIHKI